MADPGQIDSFLKKHGSPLAGLGRVFVAAGKKYGVDPALVVSISGIESGFGAHNLGAHNAWGWGPGKPFPSWQAAIMHVTQGLKQGYIDQGLRTPSEIVKRYSPGSAGNDEGNWASTVSQFMRDLGSSPGAGTTSVPAVTKTIRSSVPATPLGFPGLALRNAALSNLSQIAAHGRIDPSAMLSNLVHAVSTAQAEAKTGKPSTALQGLAAQPANPAGSTRGQGIVRSAKTQLGIPYQWGGQAKLGSRTDCSGLLQASAAANGISIPRTTYEQYKVGTPVSRAALKAGDAVFFHPGPNGPEHVGIYIGNGKMIEDPHTGSVVRISDFSRRNGFVGARRY